jgi:hypothetical protein
VVKSELVALSVYFYVIFRGVSLSVNRVSISLIRALKSLYEDSGVCVRINGAYSDWLNIDKGVRQGCVVLPWLFNLFMDNCLTRLKAD